MSLQWHNHLKRWNNNCILYQTIVLCQYILQNCYVLKKVKYGIITMTYHKSCSWFGMEYFRLNVLKVLKACSCLKYNKWRVLLNRAQPQRSNYNVFCYTVLVYSLYYNFILTCFLKGFWNGWWTQGCSSNILESFIQMLYDASILKWFITFECLLMICVCKKCLPLEYVVTCAFIYCSFL